MIKLVEISGFKSFGSPPQRVELSPLTFLAGPNACGKSNFLNALKFLQNAIRQDVEFACNDLGGPAEVRNKLQRQRKDPKLLTITIELDDEVRVKIPTPLLGAKPHKATPPHVTAQVSRFRYSLSADLRQPDGVPVIVDERFTCQVLVGDVTTNHILERDLSEVRLHDTLNPESDEEKRFPVPDGERARPAINATSFSLAVSIFRSIVGGWSFFNISPHVARQSYRETADAKLGTLGENLAVVLHKLSAHNGKTGLKAIIENLKSVIPGFKAVEAKHSDIEGRWVLQVTEENIRGVISPASVSDGTIRLLALMVIAHSGKLGVPLIAIEEPENGIHPHLCAHLVDVFREATSHSQIIATTHNPSFLDHLEPEEVLLCGKKDGLSRLRRADGLKELDAFRKHFSLGELYVQGTFDGMLEE